ncbi:MAG: glycosyl hydrolase family 28 protein [Bacteroidota bacterium]
MIFAYNKLVARASWRILRLFFGRMFLSMEKPGRGIKPIVLLLALCVVYGPVGYASTYNILDFGATPSRNQLSTEAIQSAIDSCHARGGGQVIIPSGRFLTGSVELKSNVELHLDVGAVLLGSTQMADYDPAHPHLIWSMGANHIQITGYGTIDGQGEAFFEKNTKKPMRSWRAKERPKPWIHLQDGQDITIRNVRLINSPAHVIDLNNSKNILIDGIHIRNDKRSPNTDGIDVRGSKEVIITNCFIDTGDDAICLKSSKGDVENVVVSNCMLSSDDAAIKLGTGSRYVIRHLLFSNIIIRESRYGIAMFMGQGGVFEHCIFRQISIQTASRHNMEYPIFLDIHKRNTDSPLGRIRNVQLAQIDIHTRGNILIAGQAEAPIESLSLDAIQVYLSDPWDLTNVNKKPRGNKKFGEIKGLVDYAAIPSTLTFGHIQGLQVDDLQLFYETALEEGLERHAIAFKQVQAGVLRGFREHAERSADGTAKVLQDVESKIVVEQ